MSLLEQLLQPFADVSGQLLDGHSHNFLLTSAVINLGSPFCGGVQLHLMQLQFNRLSW